MCSIVASLTGEMAARSFAYHAHGTADSDKSQCLCATTLGGCCRVNSRSTAMEFSDAQIFLLWLRKHSNASRIRRAITVNLKLTWLYPLSEFRPTQTRAVYVIQVHLSLWVAMAVGMNTSLT